MKYCNSCNRTTYGEPLFCNHCGSSYDVKLCPRHHPNPRNAEACSECGSRDLSTPHRKLSIGKRLLIFLLMKLPILLTVAGLAVVLVMVVKRLLFGPYAFLPLMCLALFFGLLLWFWMMLPQFLRNGIKRIFGKAKREGKR